MIDMCKVKKRRGSIAIEALTTFVTALLILIVLLGTLISVFASDSAEWAALNTLEDTGLVYNVLPDLKSGSVFAINGAANLSYGLRMKDAKGCSYLPVIGIPDDYGSVAVRFSYGFNLKAALDSDYIVLPMAGFQRSDGIDFSESMVYITRTGEKYHEEGCHHLKKSKIGIDLQEAIEKGYEPCKNCH